MDEQIWSNERTLALTDELAKRGLLELASDPARQSFASKLADHFGANGDAGELAEWIVEQPEVLELHASDEQLRAAMRSITGEPEKRQRARMAQRTRPVTDLLPEGVAAELADATRLHRDLPPEDGQEIRWVDLCPLAELAARTFPIGTHDYWANQDEPGVDPHLEYDVAGVDLVKACNDTPTGVLVWFPELGEFGSWDRDHRIAITFPGVAWKTIVTQLSHYVNAQWNPRVEHAMLRPWADPRCAQIVPRKR